MDARRSSRKGSSLVVLGNDNVWIDLSGRSTIGGVVTCTTTVEHWDGLSWHASRLPVGAAALAGAGSHIWLAGSRVNNISGTYPKGREAIFQWTTGHWVQVMTPDREIVGYPSLGVSPSAPAGLCDRRAALRCRPAHPCAEADAWVPLHGRSAQRSQRGLRVRAHTLDPRGQGEAAATVLRDAYAQAWQVSAHACMTCRPECQGVRSTGTCVDERDISRYGDASPALIYCAEGLVDAFPDAKIIQIVRDGRAVAAAMLSDPEELAWFRRGVANVDSEFPNPFFGVETEDDRAAWPELSNAGKCAMRWRGAVTKMARLRNSMSADQLTTLRYEQLIKEPRATVAAVSDFIETKISAIEIPHGRKQIEGWRRLLSPAQLAEIEKVAGQQLRRVGYGD